MLELLRDTDYVPAEDDEKEDVAVDTDAEEMSLGMNAEYEEFRNNCMAELFVERPPRGEQISTAPTQTQREQPETSSAAIVEESLAEMPDVFSNDKDTSENEGSGGGFEF